MNLFLDIETVPAEEKHHEVLREIHARKLANNRKVSAKFEDYLAATSFDGSFGRIICIGYATDDKPAQVISGTEKEILEKFWEIAKEAKLFIGFNCMDFDLRFIYQRSVINKIKPTVDLSFRRYYHDQIYDVMYEWTKWAYQQSVSLDTLAKALGIPSSKGGGIEGKDVAKAYKDGRIKEICDYCKKDVEVTREIYKRMTFSK